MLCDNTKLSKQSSNEYVHFFNQHFGNIILKQNIILMTLLKNISTKYKISAVEDKNVSYNFRYFNNKFSSFFR